MKLFVILKISQKFKQIRRTQGTLKLGIKIIHQMCIMNRFSNSSEYFNETLPFNKDVKLPV